MSEHFHRAARDGALSLLKEATRKDCNAKDVDGMTPTLWSAFEGNLEALRLLTGRGGDPEKCDNYGNTALHIAAARGHLNCVTFLVNFGVNLWSMDIDFHTAKDLAAMNDRQDILRFLDEAVTKQERSNPRSVKALKEKANKEAEKRAKDFKKIQDKAAKLAAQEQERLTKERLKMEKQGSKPQPTAQVPSVVPRPSMAALTLRKDSVQLYGQSMKFSDMVGTQGHAQKKVPAGAVSKKVLQQMKLKKTGKNIGSVKSNSTNALNEVGNGDFKVGAIESDGKRSVRSISGLVRDSEVMYVPKFDSNPNAKRGKLSGIFNGSSENVSNGQGGLSRASSEPGYLNEDGNDEIPAFQPPRGSIFERPGFGSMAFRHSITATLSAMPNDEDKMSGTNGSSNHKEDLNGSASGLKNRTKSWGRDELDDTDSDDDEEENGTALHFFLAAAGLQDFVNVFIKEDIDLEALVLLSDSDLQSLGLPLGPRRKLLKAIQARREAMEDPGEMEDSHL